MTVSELRSLIERREAPAVLDVRSGWEFGKGHVPGARHLPFWRAFLPSLKVPDEPLVIYCGLGPRAWLAAVGLRARGYRNLQMLQGHWATWQRDRT